MKRCDFIVTCGSASTLLTPQTANGKDFLASLGDYNGVDSEAVTFDILGLAFRAGLSFAVYQP